MDSRFRGNDLPTLANPSTFAKANYEGQVASFVGQSKERICLEHLFVGIINEKYLCFSKLLFRYDVEKICIKYLNL